ncbi:flavodoxin FldA [Bacteroides fragilis]|uniref:flavodoxin FldA n=1 Tax=Bacteroides fragilis TaxID=817 RepID=UPI00202F21C5|nr:flavodoxin FldA [Bacteroides fragilis]MCM0207322.1 flavodoxin FldA [Bacteroides fragilis]MCM0322398.1 flavodoxin FldA [Bacteroides fragilis]
MNKIGVFYGSTTGTTEDVARRIAEKLNVPKGDIHDASKLNDELVKEYDVLVLGTSTWGAGELQDDWYDGIKVLKKADLSHKFVALFGCGDSDSYGDTFCDGIGILYEELKDTHCTFCGATDPSDYTFDSSVAVVNGKFVGLPLDEVNEDNKTDERIAQWTESLKKECIN